MKRKLREELTRTWSSLSNHLGSIQTLKERCRLLERRVSDSEKRLEQAERMVLELRNVWTPPAVIIKPTVGKADDPNAWDENYKRWDSGNKSELKTCPMCGDTTLPGETHCPGCKHPLEGMG